MPDKLRKTASDLKLKGAFPDKHPWRAGAGPLPRGARVSPIVWEIYLSMRVSVLLAALTSPTHGLCLWPHSLQGLQTD